MHQPLWLSRSRNELTQTQTQPQTQTYIENAIFTMQNCSGERVNHDGMANGFRVFACSENSNWNVFFQHVLVCFNVQRKIPKKYMNISWVQIESNGILLGAVLLHLILFRFSFRVFLCVIHFFLFRFHPLLFCLLSLTSSSYFTNFWLHIILPALLTVKNTTGFCWI